MYLERILSVLQNTKKMLTEKENTFRYFPIRRRKESNPINELRKLELIPESHRTVPNCY